MAELFTQVVKPTATMETAGAFLGRWRLMSIDGMAWDIPDIPANAAAFGYPRAGKDGAPGAFPKAQVVTVSECASHAAVLAAIGPFALKAGGERALARRLYPKLEEDWLLIADSGFYDRQDWCTAADTGAGAAVAVQVRHPASRAGDSPRRLLPVSPGHSEDQGRGPAGARRDRRAGEELDPGRARHVRVVEYEILDRDGEDKLVALVTTITDPLEAPAAALAAAYHQRWEHETANAQLKTFLRVPGNVLRSQSPDMIEQEIWGYLLTHYAISALIGTATSAGIDPDRVKFKRTIRAVRRRVADPAFPLTSASASWTKSPKTSPAART